MGQLFSFPKQRAFDAAGDPLQNARLFFYHNQTTTPKNTYADSDLNTPHTNPVVSDAFGIFEAIWLDTSEGNYTVRLTDSNNAQQWTVDDVGASDLTQSNMGAILNPPSDEENAVPVTVVSPWYATEYIRVKRYMNASNADGQQANAAECTAASQAALLVANEHDGARVVWEHGGFVIDEPLVPDADGLDLIGDGADLIQGANIPAGGAIFHSMSGGDDANDNQAVLDGIYGADVVSVRTNKPNSLLDVRIRGFRMNSGSAVAKGIWIVGFTRGCELSDMSFLNFKDHDVMLNGSWSFMVRNLRMRGDGALGIGLGIGKTGYGTRNGATACNAFKVMGCHAGNHLNGMEYDFGVCASFDANTVEGNAGDGFSSQSARSLDYRTMYHENNGGHNCRLGGTNGTDYVDSMVMQTCQFNALSGQSPTRRNINLQSVRNSFFGHNANSYDEADNANFVSNMYFIPTSGGSRVYKNTIYTRGVSGTYIGNASELDLTKNLVYTIDGTDIISSVAAMNVRGDLRHLGTNLGFYSAAVVSKQTVSGIRDSNAALADALTELAEVGLITDSTTAT